MYGCTTVQKHYSYDTYSTVQQKKIKIKSRQGDLNSRTAEKKAKKNKKSRDRGIWTDAVLVQNRTLYRWAKRRCSDYLLSPGGQLWKIVARRVWMRRPLFRRGSRGLLCGWDPAPSRSVGGSGGARDLQLFLGYIITSICFQRSNWTLLLLPRSII